MRSSAERDEDPQSLQASLGELITGAAQEDWESGEGEEQEPMPTFTPAQRMQMAARQRRGSPLQRLSSAPWVGLIPFVAAIIAVVVLLLGVGN